MVQVLEEADIPSVLARPEGLEVDPVRELSGVLPFPNRPPPSQVASVRLLWSLLHPSDVRSESCGMNCAGEV